MIAMSGQTATILIIIFLVVVCGCIVVTDDFNWFD